MPEGLFYLIFFCQDVFMKSHQHGSDFRAGGGAKGIQHAAVFSLHQARVDRPAYAVAQGETLSPSLKADKSPPASVGRPFCLA